ncbi:MAG: HU family DNA-binding protein [Deltaproteobacteria bacterium]|nr:HU family DNA-binding protein [Deltaproteobacteria bacterium]
MELIKKIAKDAEISEASAGRALNSFIDGVITTLKKKDGSITLVGFGTFKKVHRKARKGRNPQTGEIIKIKGKNVVRFSSGKKLIEFIA